MSAPATRNGRRRETGAVDVRGPVAVLLSRFPTVTETFVLREICEMERQGQPVRLVPLLRDDPPVVHEEARPWIERALFTPYLSPGILAANLRTLLGAPLRYLSVLVTLVVGMGRSPGFLLRTLALFPKSVYLARRLEADGIRHVHAHFATHPATVAWVVARLSELSFSVTVHAHDIFVDRTFLGPKLTAASFVRVVSEFNRRYLLSRVPGLDPDRVRVVHVGVDVEGYASACGGGRPEADARDTAPGRDAAGGPAGPESPLILTVAALRPYKGIQVLLDACRLLLGSGIDVRVEVVGEGPLREELEARAARRGIAERVRFRGAVPEDRIPELLSRASVFVLPSVMQEDGQMDGIPVALMEAMAAGVPVVASELSGIPELVRHGDTGVLVPPGDAETVASAVRSLLSQPGWAHALGQRGHTKVREAFDLQGCTALLLELLREHGGTVPPRIREDLRSSTVLRHRASAVGVRRVHRGPDSWVAELLLGAAASPGPRAPEVSDAATAATETVAAERNGPRPWPPEVVWKVHLSRPGASRPAPDRARTEFDVLLKLAGAADVRAPRPLDLDEAAATVVMSRCPGDSLLDLTRDARWSRTDDHVGEVRAALRRTGAWLGSFQVRCSLHGSAGRALDRVAIEALEAVEHLRGELLDRREAHALQWRILNLRARVHDDPGLVLRHGDFWPGNVQVSDDGEVAVLDFEGTGPGHPLEDPAYFTVHLSLYLSYPGMERRRSALEKAFVAGFGNESVERSAAFDLCRRSVAARLLRADAGAGRLIRPTRWLRRRHLLEILHGRGR